MSWEKSNSFLLYLYIRNKNIKNHENSKNHRLLGIENDHRNTHTANSTGISSDWMDREQDSEDPREDQHQDQRTRIKMTTGKIMWGIVILIMIFGAILFLQKTLNDR